MESHILDISPLLPAALLAFAIALATAVLLVLTQRWHGVFTLDSTRGVQKLHAAPTPRVGGVPIALALAAAWPMLPAGERALLEPVLLAAMPAAAFGLAEDLTRRVGVAARLLATLTAGALFWWLAEGGVTHVGLPLVDALLAFWPLSLALTAFAAGGMANAINIVDGLNGLAGLTTLIALSAFGLLALGAGDSALAGACVITAAVVLGFWLVNWPLGKLFLGDGGAYVLGFLLGCLGILLSERNPEISAFAVLLVCAHPVTEVLFSVWRRRCRAGAPGHPDALHLHSLVKRRLMRRLLPHRSASARNSLAGLLVAAGNVVPAALALAVHHSTALSALAVLFAALGYVALYARLVRFRWCSPLAFLMGRSPPPGVAQP